MEVQNLASIPRSEKILGRADGPAGLAVGDAVRITVAKVGNRYQVALADPTSVSGIPAVAVVLKKLGATDHKIQFHGPVKNTYTGLTPGEVYYLGTDGRPAAVGDANFPVAGGAAHFQQLGVATSSDELLLNPLRAAPGSLSGGARYYRQALTGTVDGVNTTFTTALKFVGTAPRRETVFYNGQRLDEGVGCDYVISESVLGAGYDTVTFAFAPKIGDQLSIDFDPDF